MDEALFMVVQSLAGQSAVLDRAISNIATNPVLKGVPPMLLFWSLWFSAGTRRQVVRAQLLAMVVVAAVALAAGRILTTFLPFRLRPFHTPGTEMNLSFDLDPATLSGWSSFPSDHAVMFFALAACLWAISKTAGAVAIVHATIAIAFGRVFLGFHWPVDILGGALIGIITARILLRPLAEVFLRKQVVPKCSRFENVTYPVLFLVTYQIATMFDGVRDLAGAIGRAVRL